MSVNKFAFDVATQGHSDMVNITDMVQEQITSDITGILCLHSLGTTAALVIMEDEQGLEHDFINLFEKYIPEHEKYQHHQKWGDKNGAAHLKSAILGVHLTILVEEGKLVLGTWQSIMLIDFDERPRQRQIRGIIVTP